MTYYINDGIQASTWFDEFSYCKSLGMDLYSPQSDEINLQMIEILENAGYDAGFSLGGSRVGTKSFWYSTKTGLEIDFKFRPRESTRENIWENYCLGLVKIFKKYQYQDVDCYTLIGNKHFVCEWMNY
jgi:hypothetical protein